MTELNLHPTSKRCCKLRTRGYKRRLRWCVPTVLVSVLFGFFYGVHLYSAMNMQLETPLPNLVSGIHRIHFQYSENYKRKIMSSIAKRSYAQSYCDNENAILPCTYWNPSIFPLSSHQYLIAVRQSTRQGCGDFKGTIVTAVRYLTKPYISNVFIGSFNPKELLEGSKKELIVSLDQQLPDSYEYSPNASHVGHEDPRWIIDQDRLYLLTSSERLGKPRLFLTRVTINQHQIDNKNDGDLVTFHKTVELMSRFIRAPYRQKNWMNVPISIAEKPSKKSKFLLFVYQSSPILSLVWVDPDTGRIVQYNLSQHPPPIVDNIRGSSTFIRETNSTYLGIVHTNLPPPSSIIGFHFNIYYSYLVRLEKEPMLNSKLWTWKITHKTAPLAMPIDANNYAHRVQFVTTLTEHESEFWISMGDMDCDSHILRIPRTALLRLLNKGNFLK